MLQRIIAGAVGVLVAAATLGGCGVAAVGPDDCAHCSTGSVETSISAADAGTRTSAPASAPASTPTSAPVDPAEAATCRAWTAARDQFTQMPTWSAGAGTCDPGSLPAATRHASLAWVNLYRSMAGLGPVAEAAADVPAAQGCAVMLERNGQLTHTPPSSWACASAAARAGAARSNLSGNVGFPMSPWASAHGWIDEGHDLTDDLGHRRWLLSPELSTVTYGQTGSFACLTLGLAARDPRAPQWVAWPPAGWVPTALVGAIWSFSKPGVSAAGTTVQVFRDGAPVAVAAGARRSGYGDDTVSWEVPSVTAGSVYRVRVAVPGAAAVEYDVRPTTCAPR